MKIPFPIKLLVLVFLLSPIAQPALGAEKQLRTITVTGAGMERVPTTLTDVSLGVEVQGKTALAAQQEAARRSSAVVTYLRSQHVERLQTTGIGLNLIYGDNSQRPTGYTATNIVSFRVSNNQAGTILDQAVQAGATRIDSVSFAAADSAIAAAQQQALQIATQNALKQADAVLSSLNFTRREVVSIQVNNATPPQPLRMPYAANAASVARAVPTPVIGGEQQVEGSVTLEISY